ALSQLQADPATTIPLLIKLLGDTRDDLPPAAAEALGNYGTQARAAVPKLLELLKVPDKELRHAINGALPKIDPEAAKRLQSP
ncbi:MAG TPA: HEAT repeat domain-containing protein, partial [Verrucomicrobiae bacterium]|nr:HEAT repeat domain-containing protein [Verrucomicrobiae bacterium]